MGGEQKDARHFPDFVALLIQFRFRILDLRRRLQPPNTALSSVRNIQEKATAPRSPSPHALFRLPALE
jgi:hypothetical protein